MICRKCGTEYVSETIGFKISCEKCGLYLHSCFQCNLFDRTSERCRSLKTEAVRDRENMNYCEEYIPNTLQPFSLSDNSSAAKDSFNKLFGDPDHKIKQKRETID